jgi:hypothetical protein
LGLHKRKLIICLELSIFFYIFVLHYLLTYTIQIIMKKILVILLAFTATFSFGQTDTTEVEESYPERIEYAIQIASTTDIDSVLQNPYFNEEVIDAYEIEKVLLDGVMVYRFLVHAQDLVDAYIKHSHYRKTTYRNCTIVTFRNGDRID